MSKNKNKCVTICEMLQTRFESHLIIDMSGKLSVKDRQQHQTQANTAKWIFFVCPRFG